MVHLLLSNNAEPYTLCTIPDRTQASDFRTSAVLVIQFITDGLAGLSLLGHQLSWRPVSWLELNLKQTIVYTGTYNLIANYLEMFTGKEANIGGKAGTNRFTRKH
jgi:hypothetical protein